MSLLFRPVLSFWALIGRFAIEWLVYLGELLKLCWDMLVGALKGRHYPREMARQLVSIGFGSQPVIMVTGAFTGAVFAAQSVFLFRKVGLDSAVGVVVSLAMCRELGPVLTGLMLAGRVGAAMAAELGSMKVGEQIDAMRSMAVHPIDFLVIPRLSGMLISVPLLIAEAIALGLAAAYILGVWIFDIPGAWFMDHVRRQTHLTDIGIGMTKGVVFGFLTVLIACHQGLTVTKGAVGVGKATTAAVVNTSLAILIVNFFLTVLFNVLFPIHLSS